MTLLVYTPQLLLCLFTVVYQPVEVLKLTLEEREGEEAFQTTDSQTCYTVLV